MNTSVLNLDRKSSTRAASGPQVSLNHPDDVVIDPRLSLAEKRALLALWASDSHAVEDEPTLRQLDNGAVVSLNEIRRAIDRLDHDEPKHGADAKAWGFPSARRHSPLGARKMKISRRWGFDDDDDDPPPSPVHAAVPKRKHPFLNAWSKAVSGLSDMARPRSVGRRSRPTIVNLSKMTCRKKGDEDMKSLKVLAVGAALVLAPMSAIAAPAESIVASKYAIDLMPPVENAIVRGDDTAKIERSGGEVGLTAGGVSDGGRRLSDTTGGVGLGPIMHGAGLTCIALGSSNGHQISRISIPRW